VIIVLVLEFVLLAREKVVLLLFALFLDNDRGLHGFDGGRGGVGQRVKGL
jgi:hypothetical protein